MVKKSPTIQEMMMAVAIALRAKSFVLLENKKYRFYLTDNRHIDKTKKEVKKIIMGV